jgi:hypothetical protein
MAQVEEHMPSWSWGVLDLCREGEGGREDAP